MREGKWGLLCCNINLASFEVDEEQGFELTLLQIST
jgi:hypothetical protein